MANENNPTNVPFDNEPELETGTIADTAPAEADFDDEALEPEIGEQAETTLGDDIGGAKRSTSQQLKDEAGKFAGQAADRARAFAGEGKDRATGALDDLTKMIEGAALDVDARLGEQYGEYARTAARGVATLADGLRGKEVDDLIEDATALVKKSPVIAVGAAAAIGFVLARLIKSGIDAAADAGDPPAPQA